MVDTDEMAARGRHVLLLGLILAGLIGAVLWMMGTSLLSAVADAPSSRFRGSPAQAWQLLLGFASLVSTGLAFVASGAAMIAGRSSRLPTCAGILLFAVALVFIGAALASAYPA